jgi:phosphoribosylformylglycinamidine cyclo-ligase
MKDTADYEASEKIAISVGKKALSNARWLHNREVEKTKGFFVELRENNHIHPKHYSVHCVDGVGTKVFLSAWSGNYRLAPIDALAMNANDMATIIHAYPDALNLYIATQTGVEEKHMGEIMSGFIDALEKIRIPKAPFDVNIGKIETASLDEIISLGIPDKGVDFGVVLTGYIQKNKVPSLDPQRGDIIVGVSSTGLHSNGYTGARHVLFTPEVEYRDEWKSQYKGRYHLHDKPSILKGKTVLEALQVPTALYLVEASLVGQHFENPEIYGVNMTGNGLHNFNRAGKSITFEITDPLEPLPIHKLLIQESKWTPAQAYTKQNMGMGFAYIAPNIETAEGIVKLINERGENKAKIIGEVAANDEWLLKTILHKPYEGKSLDFIGYSN